MGSDIQKLQKILEKTRQRGKKAVLCHGCFDGLHEGHLRLFQKARELADLVVVGIEGDRYIKQAKGKGKPFCQLRDRIDAVIKTGLVDHVFVIPSGSAKVYKEIYRDLRPDFLVTAIDELTEKKERDAIEVNMAFITIEKTEHSLRSCGKKYKCCHGA